MVEEKYKTNCFEWGTWGKNGNFPVNGHKCDIFVSQNVSLSVISLSMPKAVSDFNFQSTFSEYWELNFFFFFPKVTFKIFRDFVEEKINFLFLKI